MLCATSVSAMNIPCSVIDSNGKSTGTTIFITPYHDRVEVNLGAKQVITVPYIGDANGAGWEYRDARWDVIMGKTSPTKLSVMVFDARNQYGCGGYITFTEK